MAEERDDLKATEGQAQDAADAVRDLINELDQLDGKHARATVDVTIGDVPDAGEAVERESRPARVRSAYQPAAQPTYPEPIAPPSTVQELIRRQPVLGPVVRPIPPAVPAPPPAFQPPPRAVQPVSLPSAVPPLLSPLTPPAIASALRGPAVKQDVPELPEAPGRPERVQAPAPLGDKRQLQEPPGKLQVETPGAIPASAPGAIPVNAPRSIPVQAPAPIPVQHPGALEVRQPAPLPVAVPGPLPVQRPAAVAPPGRYPPPVEPTQPRQPGPRGPVDVRVVNWPAGFGQPMPERLTATTPHSPQQERLSLAPLLTVLSALGGGLPASIASFGAAVHGLFQGKEKPSRPAGYQDATAPLREVSGGGTSLDSHQLVAEMRGLGQRIESSLSRLGRTFESALAKYAPGGARGFGQPIGQQQQGMVARVQPGGGFLSPLQAGLLPQSAGPHIPGMTYSQHPALTQLVQQQQGQQAAAASGLTEQVATGGMFARAAGSAAKLASVAAAAAMIGRQGMQLAEGGARNWSDERLSLAEKMQQSVPGKIGYYDPTGLVSSATVGLGKLAGVFGLGPGYQGVPTFKLGRRFQPDKLQGVIESELRQSGQRYEEQAIRGEAGAAIRQQMLPLIQHSASAQAMVKAFDTIKPAIAPPPNAMMRPWEYQHWQAEVPLRQQQAMAKREAVAAEAGSQAVQAKHAEAVQRRTRLQTEERGLQTRIAQLGNSLDPNDIQRRAEALQRVVAVQRELKAAVQEEGALEQAATQASIEASNKRAAARQSEIALQRHQLAIAQENTGRAKSATVNIGMMHEGERQFALGAVEQLKKYGPQALAGSQLEMIRRVGGDRLLEQEALKSAEKSPTYRKLREAVGESTLREATEKELRLQQEIHVAVDLNLQESARDVARELSPAQIAKVKATALEAVEAKIREMRNQQLQARP